MNRFLHVAFGFEDKPATIEDVQKALANASWARYAPNCWLVHTDEAPQSLAQRLRALCKETDSLYVCEFKIDNGFGWLQQEIWDWMTRVKS